MDTVFTESGDQGGTGEWAEMVPRRARQVPSARDVRPHGRRVSLGPWGFSQDTGWNHCPGNSVHPSSPGARILLVERWRGGGWGVRGRILTCSCRLRAEGTQNRSAAVDIIPTTKALSLTHQAGFSVLEQASTLAPSTLGLQSLYLARTLLRRIPTLEVWSHSSSTPWMQESWASRASLPGPPAIS